jgi:hypothetical protein
VPQPAVQPPKALFSVKSFLDANFTENDFIFMGTAKFPRADRTSEFSRSFSLRLKTSSQIQPNSSSKAHKLKKKKKQSQRYKQDESLGLGAWDCADEVRCSSNVRRHGGSYSDPAKLLATLSIGFADALGRGSELRRRGRCTSYAARVC